jgi:nucleotide-binding universal stress UspA family protein
MAMSQIELYQRDAMPPRVNLDDIREDLGGLKAQMAAVLDAIGKGDKSRKEIHEKLEKLGIELLRANNSIRTVTTKVETMEPKVADWVKLRQNVSGALIVLTGVGAVIFVVIGFILKDLWAWIVAHVHLK